jgi:hypothetical protein
VKTGVGVGVKTGVGVGVKTGVGVGVGTRKDFHAPLVFV